MQWPIEKRRDVDATYNPRTAEQLLASRRVSPGRRISTPRGSARGRTFVVSELTAVRDLAELFNRDAAADMKAYLTFHYLSDHAPYLPKRFDDGALRLLRAHAARPAAAA